MPKSESHWSRGSVRLREHLAHMVRKMFTQSARAARSEGRRRYRMTAIESGATVSADE
jgi:hypothetical protein